MGITKHSSVKKFAILPNFTLIGAACHPYRAKNEKLAGVKTIPTEYTVCSPAGS